MHDVVIRGGTVVDGTGAPRRTADVAIDAGRVVAVGQPVSKGRRELDADGLLVTPGWVDIHTHYDGQVTWDPEVTPSSWHGVTTVVMGNCGVGFAPVRPDGKDFLIELMEGVEDIPGTALHEGMDWGWESFPEYLDMLAGTAKVLDVAAQVPHAALRAYVLGERAHEDASDDEVGEMAKLVEEAMVAGAAGFSTSRFVGHRSKYGLMPGTVAPAGELLAIADAVGRAGHGVIQVVADGLLKPNFAASPDRGLVVEMARRSGRTVSYTLAQAIWGGPHTYREALADAELADRDGLTIRPQVAVRPFGLLYSLQSDFHPFVTCPTYRAIAHLPVAERARRLSEPETRAAVLGEADLANRWAMGATTFKLGDPPDYEPAPETSADAIATATGATREAVVLDWLLEDDGRSFVFPFSGGYRLGDLECMREMIEHPHTIIGGSDAGAHCRIVADASSPTSLLTLWARDRTRGPRLSIEHAVHMQTARTAAAWGMRDRGTIEPGRRADINLVDFDRLRLHGPEMRYDLPTGGPRLVQHVEGYRATLVAGETTFEDGEPTGARPGGLVRFGR